MNVVLLKKMSNMYVCICITKNKKQRGLHFKFGTPSIYAPGATINSTSASHGPFHKFLVSYSWEIV